LVGGLLLMLSLLVASPFDRSVPDGRLQLTQPPTASETTNYSPARGRRVLDRAPATGTAYWTRLPDPVLSPRKRPLLVWTGEEVLVFGGGGRRDGAAWSPDRRRWRHLPVAPAPLRTNIAVWTGDEAVILTPAATLLYRPDRDAWEQTPGPPPGLLAEDRSMGDATILGEEVVVVGSGAQAAAVYDLRRHQWRPLAVPSPADFVDTPAVITHGSRVAVLGDTSQGSVGWSMSLEDDGVRPLPTNPWPPDAPELSWFRAVASAGDRFVIAQNSTQATRAAVLRASGWRPLPNVSGLAQHPIVVGINAGVVVWSSEVGRGAIYRRSAAAWQEIDPAPLLTSAGAGVAMGNQFFLWNESHAAVWTPGRS
jgi:hypothetical protein